MPAVDKERPAVGEIMPAVGKARPAVASEMPSVDVKMTADREPKPAVADAMTAADSVKPAVDDLLPSVGLKMPAACGKMPAVMARYSLRDLAKATGASPHAIRHYVKGGLLAPAVRAGQSSFFGDSHVLVLGIIARLRAEGHRGVALKERLPAEIARATAAPPPPPAPPPAPATMPPPPPSRRPSVRDAVDAAVCAAAESLDVSPRGLRVALEAVLRRLHEAGVSPGEAAKLVARSGNDG